MKKILLGTTALAAAGMLAFPASDAMAQDKMEKPQPITISIGGYFNSWIGFADQDGSFESAATAGTPAGTGYRNVNIHNDSEIYFSGHSTLDNGLRVDVIIQLETDQAVANPHAGGTANSDTPIDESYVKLTGGFGDVRMGATKAASFVLGTPTLPAGVLRHDTLDVGKFVVAPNFAGGAIGNTGVNTPASPFFLNGIQWDVGPSDALKLVYITPLFAGFRWGVSYWPKGPGGDNTDTMPAKSLNSAWDTSINYNNKFGDIGVAANLQFVSQTSGNSGGTALDVKTWHGGAAVSYAGFRLSGRYGVAGTSDDGGVPATVRIVDDEQWDAELLYRSGPWGVSFTYMTGSSEESVAIAADLERTVYMLGADYAIGPGIKVGANIFKVDWDDETTAAANNNDGWAVVGGINVRF